MALTATRLSTYAGILPTPDVRASRHSNGDASIPNGRLQNPECSITTGQITLRSLFLSPCSRPLLPLKAPASRPPPRGSNRHICRSHKAPLVAPPPPLPLPKGPVDGINDWLQESHSTELTRWLEARGIRLPDFLAWLPRPLHDKLHYAEDELGILAQEIVLALLVLVFINKLKSVTRFMHHTWYDVVHKNRTDPYMKHKRDNIQHTFFGALEGPASAAALLLWGSHIYTVIAPLLNIQLAPRAVGIAREISVIGVLTWFAIQWKNNIIGELRARSNAQSTQAQLGALDKLATIVIISFGVMVTGEVAGYAFKSILALSGVSGIAISLAARDVVSNMFGGTMLYLTRPFSQGDTIKAGNVLGTVIDVGFYSTKLLTPDKQPTYVPNAYFTNQVITNLSRATSRVLTATFTLRHQDLLKVDAISDKMRDYLSSHQAIDLQSPVQVNLVNVTPYNLEIQVQAVTKAGLGGNEFNRAKHDIFIRIARMIDESGAKLSAYPDQPYPPIPVPAK